MLRGLKVSYPLIVNVILFVNISNFEIRTVYITTFSIAHPDTRDDDFAF